MGEGEGGGGKDGKYSTGALFFPPLYPLPRGEGRLVFGRAPDPALGADKGSLSTRFHKYDYVQELSEIPPDLPLRKGGDPYPPFG